jgi:hypothetical protein
MDVNLGFEPSSPSELDTFSGVPMANGPNGKARLASARNAVQHLCMIRTFMDTSFSPMGCFDAGHWEHVGAGIRLLQKRPVPCATRRATRPKTARPTSVAACAASPAPFWAAALRTRCWTSSRDGRPPTITYGRPQRLPASRARARRALRANCLNRPKERARWCRQNQFSSTTPPSK